MPRRKLRLACAVLGLVLPTVGMGAIGTGSAVAAPRQAEPCTDVETDECHGDLEVADGYTVPYFSTYPIEGSERPTHAVIVVHGSGGRYDDEFTSVVTAAELEGGQTLQDTLVVAPRFTNDEQDPGDGEAYWDESTWVHGDGAIEPDGLAAFTVMDQIIEVLADEQRFPNLETVTLTGHSAGGQFNERWAAGSRALDTLSGIELRIVVANPSSYLYLNEYRPDLEDQSDAAFIIPDVDCPYNSYKYGLEDRGEHAYLADADPREMRQRFVAQDVYYLLGEQDTDAPADQGCEAMLQGEHRFERGTLFYEWVRRTFPSADHTMLTVPGVGHDEDEMYTSEPGRRALFRDF